MFSQSCTSPSRTPSLRKEPALHQGAVLHLFAQLSPEVWCFPSPHNTTFPCTSHSPTCAVLVIFFPYSETCPFHTGSTKGIKLLIWVSEAQYPQSLPIYGDHWGFQMLKWVFSCTHCARVIFKRVLPEDCTPLSKESAEESCCCNAQKSQHVQLVPRLLPPGAPQAAGTAGELPAWRSAQPQCTASGSSTSAWLISMKMLCKTLKRFWLPHVRQTQNHALIRCNSF